MELFANSNFIELYPTDKDIWAVNSLRQLLVCKDFKKHNQIEFTPVNEIFNVMKAAMGNKHQVIVKIVKQLDETMVRDPYEEEASLEGVDDGEEEMGEIPIPSSSMMEMGVTVA